MQLLQACCGTQRGKKHNHKPWLTHPFSYVIELELWQFQARHCTHCNYYPHSDRNPISDSSGAFGVEHGLTMCHHSSQAKLPEDALDFTQMTTISMQRENTAPAAACQAAIKLNNSHNLWRAIGKLHCVVFVPPLTAPKQTLALQTWKSLPPRRSSAPSSPPTSSETLFVFKSSVITANARTRLMRHVCSQNVP